MITCVIGNGISNRKWHGVKLHPSIGCNFGIKDFDLDHLVCIDRMAVHEVNKLGLKSNTKYWCKETPLETPKGWHDCAPAGIDSGSKAIKLAAQLYPKNEIICIGFYGVIENSNDNAYQYPFRQTHRTPERIRKKHKHAIIDLLPKLPRIRFVGNQQDEQLEVITYDHALKKAITQSRSIH